MAPRHMCNVCNELQSWTLTTEIEEKIDACENRWLCRLIRITKKILPMEKLEKEQR